MMRSEKLIRDAAAILSARPADESDQAREARTQTAEQMMALAQELIETGRDSDVDV